MSLLKIFSALFAARLFGVKSYSLCPVVRHAQLGHRGLLRESVIDLRIYHSFSEERIAHVRSAGNAFMINVYAAVAQEERRMISDRTKAGLAAPKARGVKLGGPRLPAINETRQADALVRARAIAP